MRALPSPRFATTFLVFGTILGSACGEDGPRSEKPAAPGENDPAFQIRGAEPWRVVNTQATELDQEMTIIVTPPAGTDIIDGYIADLAPVRFSKLEGGLFGAKVSLEDVPVGEHQILLSANEATTAFAALPLMRSQPYYVLVTTDWDFADPGTPSLVFQDRLHEYHPELRMTHFVGPYTFTDPAMTAQRQQELVTWLVGQRDMFDDEIGLHVHPYCNFVESAGVTCITNDSVQYPGGDASGYTIKVGAYNRAQAGQLFAHAKELFQQNGLGTPTTFRAGAWTATAETLGALADQGFVADTSALNWQHVEEWEEYELYRWNMEAWSTITDTSQPYYPSETDAQSSTAPTLPILEVPDNGVMIDYVSLNQMKALFDANWQGEIIETPRTLMMGFHPAETFSEAEFRRVNDFLAYSDMHLASKHLGPVVYITLHDVVADFQ